MNNLWSNACRDIRFMLKYWSINVTIPKGASFTNREYNRLIWISPILLKVHEKLVCHKLFPFCEKYVYFSYRKGLGCSDALLTISHHLHQSFDTGMGSYILQLDFSAAFDIVSHNGLWFKLKSIGVGASVLSVCREFLSDRRQRVVVDGATSEWIPIVSGMLQGSVLGHLLFIFYSSQMFELVENRLYANADDSTLLAVVRKPADRPAIALSLNRDLSRIQEWCNHRCKILNLNKTRL